MVLFDLVGNDCMRLCVIPARGGSKRIPRKNIREFCGKPMVAWSIEAAIESGCFDSIVVSTEDPETQAVAREYGAETPFTRPRDLADDHTGIMPVVAHSIEWHYRHKHTLTAVCCLFAAAPLTQASDIRKGLEVMEDEDISTFVFTATDYPSPIQRALGLDMVTGRTRMLQPDQFYKRSQDLKPAYFDAGQFYWGKPNAWLEAATIFDDAKAILLPSWRVQDIDTEDDWIRAELIQRLLAH